MLQLLGHKHSSDIGLSLMLSQSLHKAWQCRSFMPVCCHDLPVQAAQVLLASVDWVGD